MKVLAQFKPNVEMLYDINCLYRDYSTYLTSLIVVSLFAFNFEAQFVLKVLSCVFKGLHLPTPKVPLSALQLRSVDSKN